MINPLLVVPSVREIPEVYEALDEINYDKYWSRMRLEPEAYKTLREYFLEHEEYTHLVICPDDLVIDKDSFNILLEDIKFFNFTNLSGIANLDEFKMETYSCKPLGIEPNSNSQGSYYEKEGVKGAKFILPDTIFEAGFTGFACQFIRRDLVEKLSFTGGCNKGQGCMDLQFTNELKALNIPQYVEPKAFFFHMRMVQHRAVRAWKNQGSDTRPPGWNVFVKAGDKYEP